MLHTTVYVSPAESEIFPGLPRLILIWFMFLRDFFVRKRPPLLRISNTGLIKRKYSCKLTPAKTHRVRSKINHTQRLFPKSWQPDDTNWVRPFRSIRRNDSSRLRKHKISFTTFHSALGFASRVSSLMTGKFLLYKPPWPNLPDLRAARWPLGGRTARSWRAAAEGARERAGGKSWGSDLWGRARLSGEDQHWEGNRKR